MSDKKDVTTEFFGAVMFQELTPEEAAAWEEKVARQAEERRAYVAEKIKDIPEGALPLEEKRVLVRKMFENFMAESEIPEARIAAMAEEKLNDFIVHAAACNESSKKLDEYLAANGGSLKIPTPKP